MADHPHILVLPTWYPNSRRPDYAVFFRVQTKALQRAGATVGVIFPELREITDFGGLKSASRNHFQIEHESPDGYPVLRWHGWRIPKLHDISARIFLNAAQRLYQAYIAKYGRPDIILAHTAINAGWAAKEIAKSEGIPFVVVEHSTHFARGFYSAADLDRASQTFHAAKAVYAVSEPFSSLLSDRFGVTVKYAPNAIDTAFFAPDGHRLPFNFDRPARLGFVGTMDSKKGVDVLIRAVAQLDLSHGLELRLIGEGASQNSYRALAEELGIGAKVTFLGHARQTQVRDLMLWSDIFALPSRFETFGVVLIEALATGTTVIATRSGGPESIVTEPFLGQLVAAEDSTALAVAIKEELQNLVDAPTDLPKRRNAHIAERFGSDSRARAFLSGLKPYILKGSSS